MLFCEAGMWTFRHRLINIYKELHDDCGCYIPNNGHLEKWAREGVLLLNTVLTVRAHQANSHQRHRLGGVHRRGDPDSQRAGSAYRVPALGKTRQMKKAMLNNPKHLILEAPHPSPLSAYRGFFGCGHFSQTNRFLKANGLDPIDWQIENL